MKINGFRLPKDIAEYQAEIASLKNKLSTSERLAEDNFIAMEEAQMEHNKRVDELAEAKKQHQSFIKDLQKNTKELNK